MKICRRFLVLIALALPASARCQSIGPATVNIAGGSAILAGKTYEYALGQTVAGYTVASANLIGTPGVLQPQFSAAADVHGLPAPEASFRLYPNPASTTLYIQTAFPGRGILQYSLYDAAGRAVLQREAVLDNGTARQTLELSSLAVGPYQLRLTWKAGNNQISQATYKIHKIQ